MAQVNDGLTYGLDQFKFGSKVLVTLVKKVWHGAEINLKR